MANSNVAPLKDASVRPDPIAVNDDVLSALAVLNMYISGLDDSRAEDRYVLWSSACKAAP